VSDQVNVDQEKIAAAQRLIDDGDMRIEIVRREINQGALAGLESAITDQAAAMVIAVLDSFDRHLGDRDREELEQARRGRCLQSDCPRRALEAR